MRSQILSFGCLADVEKFVDMLNYARKAQETDMPIMAYFLNSDGTFNLPRMLDGPEWAAFNEERKGE